MTDIRPPNILAIDDDRAILLLIEQAFQDSAKIYTAESAASGLSVLREQTVDVVLLDIMLPDRSGLDMVELIHEMDDRLPVIIMTVEASCNTAVEAMQSGAFEYLSKPLGFSSLRALISRAVEQRRQTGKPVGIAADDSELRGPSEAFIGRCDAMLESPLRNNAESPSVRSSVSVSNRRQCTSMAIMTSSMCAEEDLDFVHTATPLRWRTPICVAAMRSGKHAAAEIPAAVTLEEGWQLVETLGATDKHCVMMENVN